MNGKIYVSHHRNMRRINCNWEEKRRKNGCSFDIEAFSSFANFNAIFSHFGNLDKKKIVDSQQSSTKLWKYVENVECSAPVEKFNNFFLVPIAQFSQIHK